MTRSLSRLSAGLAIAVAASAATYAVAQPNLGSAAPRPAAEETAPAADGKPTLFQTKRIRVIPEVSHEVVNLVKKGPFTLSGQCSVPYPPNYAGHTAFVKSSTKAYAIGTLDTANPDTIGSTPAQLAGASTSEPAESVDVSTVDAYTPSSIHLQASIFQVPVRNSAAEIIGCSFWVSGTYYHP